MKNPPAAQSPGAAQDTDVTAASSAPIAVRPGTVIACRQCPRTSVTRSGPWTDCPSTPPIKSPPALQLPGEVQDTELTSANSPTCKSLSPGTVIALAQWPCASLATNARQVPLPLMA